MMINGRFVHAEPGGFRKYAIEVSSRLPDATVVSPHRTVARGASGKIWEQTRLARLARDEVLWSPATSGPIRHPRHLVTLHDVAPLADPEAVGGRFGLVHKRLIPGLARSAATVVVDSAIMATEIEDRFDVSPERLRVAPPGVDAVFREAATIPRAEARRMLGLERWGLDVSASLVGGLVSSIPRKNAAGLLKALEAVVSSRSAAAMVAGWDGPSRVFGRAPRPTSSRIPDLGSLSDANLALFYRCLDVFIWLPGHEGFGLPVVEAAAVGTPVVCTAVPAAMEHLAPDFALADGTSSVSGDVERLLADPAGTSRVASAARERVDSLTWDRTALIVSDAADQVAEMMV